MRAEAVWGTKSLVLAAMSCLAFSSFVRNVEAQSTAGPGYAGAVGTNGFTNPANAVGSEQALCATVYGTSWSGFWNSFGFAIPSSATINGIQVEIMQGWRNDPPLATSLGVVVGKNQTTLATEKRGGATTNVQTCQSSGMPIDSYGGAADLWGLSWTPADINSANFTVRIRDADGQEFGVTVNWIRVTVTYQMPYDVGVTPATTTASRLPSNGTNYPVAFTVTNQGSSSDSYDLLTIKTPGTAITVVSITGSGVTQGANPDSARLADVAAGNSSVVTVTYSVANVATGSTDTLVFTARSVASPTTADTGRLTVTVIKPNMLTAKTVSPSGTPLPGTDLTYTITITNNGSADVVNGTITDTLAAQVDFKVGSVVNNLPAGVSVAVEYSNDGGSTWTYVPASAACSAPAGYDRCVNRVRWRLLNNLSSAAPNNTGNVQFVARIP